jgi:hypothetical protein
VDETPPEQRHFFAELNANSANCFLLKIGIFGTRREALALAKITEFKDYKLIVIVSTSVHLRRAACVLRRAFGSRPISFFFVAVPEESSSIRRQNCWKTPLDRYFVLKEFFKYIFYRVCLR